MLFLTFKEDNPFERNLKRKKKVRVNELRNFVHNLLEEKQKTSNLKHFCLQI